MQRGGTRPGAGRPAGSKGKRTIAVEKAVEQAAATLGEVIPDAFPGDAHAYLMAVYKDPRQPLELRLDAAKAAIRYEKPALSSVTATHHHIPAEALDDDDLDRRIAELDRRLAERAAREEDEESRPSLSH